MLAGVLEAAKLYIVRVTKGVGAVSNDIGSNVGATMGAKLSVLLNLFWLIDILTWILPGSSLMTGGSWSRLYY